MNQPTIREHNYPLGIGLMLGSSFFLALTNLFAKELTLSLSFTLVLFLRYSVPTVLLLWLLIVTPQRLAKLRDLKTQGMRLLFIVLNQYALFFYLRYGNLLDATLLVMTSPLFMPLIARVVYKAPIKLKVWVSLVVGFVGIALILHPSRGVATWPALIGLSAGFFNACSQVTFHRLSKHTDERSLTIYLYGAASILTFIIYLVTARTEVWTLAQSELNSSAIWLLLIGVAIASVTNQLLKGRAYSVVNKAASLSALLYVSIVFAGLLDWVIYGITPDLFAWIGAVLVIMSGLILSYKRRVKNPA